MSTLYILIGLPGSGKSTWAEKERKNNQVIISSDTYRKLLFGDETDQTHNSEVFNKMRSDTYTYLKNGVDVIYDATNICIKDRRNIISAAKEVGSKVVGVLFITPIPACKERNKNRSRTVPEHVYDKMLRRFQMPLLGEGFDEISYEYAPNHLYIDCATLDYCMEGFDQKNPHHTLTLKQHCDKCAELIVNDIIYKLVAKYHDIGKLFTQSFDENKIAHYYGHENYGAYYALFCDFGGIDSTVIAKFINYHMLMYNLDKAKDEVVQKWRNILSDQEWSLLQTLHVCDVLTK